MSTTKRILLYTGKGGMGKKSTAEHLVEIYGVRILNKMPWLYGIEPLPVVVFSFFEYVFNLAIVCCLYSAFKKSSI